MAVEDGHHEIEHYHGVVTPFEQCDRFAAMVRRIDGISAAPEEFLQQEAGAGVVVDDEGGFDGVHDQCED